MPIYEYKCQSCGERYEKLQKYSDPLCKKCPHCGGPLKKLISSPAIQFKGNGFYITDYPKKNSPSAEKKSKAAPVQSDAPAEDKSAGKPVEAKSETKPPAKKTDG